MVAPTTWSAKRGNDHHVSRRGLAAAARTIITRTSASPSDGGSGTRKNSKARLIGSRICRWDTGGGGTRAAR
eukprot:8979521-Pyramimonas_sp.AAC.1